VFAHCSHHHRRQTEGLSYAALCESYLQTGPSHLRLKARNPGELGNAEQVRPIAWSDELGRALRYIVEKQQIAEALFAPLGQGVAIVPLAGAREHDAIAGSQNLGLEREMRVIFDSDLPIIAELWGLLWPRHDLAEVNGVSPIKRRAPSGCLTR
jgi:hypothetical protein